MNGFLCHPLHTYAKITFSQITGVVILEDVNKLHEKLKDKDTEDSTILCTLIELNGMNISRQCLQEIKGLGKDVKKLKKHENSKISKLARKLVKKWKSIIVESVERENRRANMGFGTNTSSTSLKRKRLKQSSIDSIVRRISHSNKKSRFSTTTTTTTTTTNFLGKRRKK